VIERTQKTVEKIHIMLEIVVDILLIFILVKIMPLILNVVQIALF